MSHILAMNRHKPGGQARMSPPPKDITPIRPKWKGTLTDRERFNRQMHYQPVDRCFNMEFGYWDENFPQWPFFAENGITNNGEADLFFNFDRIDHRRRHLDVPAVRDRWSKCARPPSADERRRAAGRSPIDGHDTIPHYIKASIVTPDDWKKVKAERFHLDDPARKMDVAALQRRIPPTVTTRWASGSAR